MPSVHFSFFLAKNLPTAPHVFQIHFWQVEKRSVTERKTPQGQQCQWGRWELAGVAVQELCPCPFPITAPSVRMFLIPARLSSLLCPGGLHASSHGVCLQYSPSLPIAPSKDAAAHRRDGRAAVTIEITLPLHRLHPL